MNPVWEAIRLNVCRKCIDGDSSGACRLPSGEQCMLELCFPSVLRTIASVQSWSVDRQIKAMRGRICGTCPEMRKDDSCLKRNTLACALDRYYPLVLEIVHSMQTFDSEEEGEPWNRSNA